MKAAFSHRVMGYDFSAFLAGDFLAMAAAGRAAAAAGCAARAIALTALSRPLCGPDRSTLFQGWSQRPSGPNMRSVFSGVQVANMYARCCSVSFVGMGGGCLLVVRGCLYTPLAARGPAGARAAPPAFAWAPRPDRPPAGPLPN